jgi:hypothetical protein
MIFKREELITGSPIIIYIKYRIKTKEQRLQREEQTNEA